MAGRRARERCALDWHRVGRYERCVVVDPAFDFCSTGHGFGDAMMRFMLRGEWGAVEFVLHTGWLLPSARAMVPGSTSRWTSEPAAAGVGCHSGKPPCEGTYDHGPCPLLESRHCYYDSSALAAEPAFEVLIAEGTDGLWRWLEKHYVENIGVRLFV